MEAKIYSGEKFPLQVASNVCMPSSAQYIALQAMNTHWTVPSCLTTNCQTFMDLPRRPGSLDPRLYLQVQWTLAYPKAMHGTDPSSKFRYAKVAKANPGADLESEKGGATNFMPHPLYHVNTRCYVLNTTTDLEEAILDNLDESPAKFLSECRDTCSAGGTYVCTSSEARAETT